MYYKIIIISFCLLISSCTSTYNRGHYVDDLLLESIKQSKNKNEVIHKVGEPSIKSKFTKNNNDIWYYIHISTKKGKFPTPEILKQKIVKLCFNDKDSLQKVLVLKDTHKDILISKNSSQVELKPSDYLKMYFNNLGKHSQVKMSQ